MAAKRSSREDIKYHKVPGRPKDKKSFYEIRKAKEKLAEKLRTDYPIIFDEFNRIQKQRRALTNNDFNNMAEKTFGYCHGESLRIGFGPLAKCWKIYKDVDPSRLKKAKIEHAKNTAILAEAFQRLGRAAKPSKKEFSELKKVTTLSLKHVKIAFQRYQVKAKPFDQEASQEDALVPTDSVSHGSDASDSSNIVIISVGEILNEGPIPAKSVFVESVSESIEKATPSLKLNPVQLLKSHNDQRTMQRSSRQRDENSSPERSDHVKTEDQDQIGHLASTASSKNDYLESAEVKSFVKVKEIEGTNLRGASIDGTVKTSLQVPVDDQLVSQSAAHIDRFLDADLFGILQDNNEVAAISSNSYNFHDQVGVDGSVTQLSMGERQLEVMAKLDDYFNKKGPENEDKKKSITDSFSTLEKDQGSSSKSDADGYDGNDDDSKTDSSSFSEEYSEDYECSDENVAVTTFNKVVAENNTLNSFFLDGAPTTIGSSQVVPDEAFYFSLGRRQLNKRLECSTVDNSPALKKVAIPGDLRKTVESSFPRRNQKPCNTNGYNRLCGRSFNVEKLDAQTTGIQKTPERQIQRDNESLKVEYFKLRNLNGSDCFIICAMIMMQSCGTIREVFENLSPAIRNKTILELKKIFNGRCNNVIQLRKTLPKQYHVKKTPQDSQCDSAELLISLLTELNSCSLDLTNLELSFSSICEECKIPQIANEKMLFKQITVFENTKRPISEHLKSWSKIEEFCKVCRSSQKFNMVWSSAGRYHFLILSFTSKPKSIFNNDVSQAITMYGERWRIIAFNQFLPADKGGHYLAYGRLFADSPESDWMEINDSQHEQIEEKNLTLMNRIVTAILFYRL